LRCATIYDDQAQTIGEMIVAVGTAMNEANTQRLVRPRRIKTLSLKFKREFGVRSIYFCSPSVAYEDAVQFLSHPLAALSPRPSSSGCVPKEIKSPFLIAAEDWEILNRNALLL